MTLVGHEREVAIQRQMLQIKYRDYVLARFVYKKCYPSLLRNKEDG